MRAQVVNNCQGPHYIQAQPVKDAAGAKKAGPLLILRPGMNLIDSKELVERRKANASFDGMFKMTVKATKAETADPTKFGKPWLEVIGKELEDHAPLSKLTYDEAAGVIALTQDTDMLAGWLRTAKPSDPIVKVINDRMKEITSGIEAA